MSVAAQPLTDDDGPLSPWWIRGMLIVMAIGFTGLIAITLLAYRNAPPIPAQVVDAQGVTLFSGDDVSEGQAVFLKYGLMDNGSIWGHGAYLGPDYSAEALHRMGEDTTEAIAQQQYRPVLGRTARACSRLPCAPRRSWSSRPIVTTLPPATLHLTAPRGRGISPANRRIGPSTSAILRAMAA